MKPVHIITPVKDSLQTTIQTIESVVSSNIDFTLDYTIYNDNSTPENTLLLKELATKFSVNLVNIADLTSHPSPNYLLILQTAQLKAKAEGAHLIIIESDVVVRENTIQ